MLATKNYYTAGHAEIYAFGDFVRPQFGVAIFNELGTYRNKQRYEVSMPLPRRWGNSVSQQFAFIPPLKSVGFSAHTDNKAQRDTAIGLESHHIERDLPKNKLNKIGDLIAVCWSCHDKLTQQEHIGKRGQDAIDAVQLPIESAQVD